MLIKNQVTLTAFLCAPFLSGCSFVQQPDQDCVSPVDCDDGDPCTTDACADDGRCSNVTAPCDDHNACTENDTCDQASGTCAGTPIDCDDGVACTRDTCDNGICSNTDNCTPPDTCDKANNACVDIPDPTDDVHTDWKGFGPYIFGGAGGDSTAWGLVNDHAWQIYEGHAGGILQIVDPTGGVVLIWAYNAFNGFVLREGWTGQTVNGARIGTTITEFRQIHPDFENLGTGYLQLESGTTTVYVTFEEDLLSEIDLRDY